MKKLNSEQEKAVRHYQGALFIVAGPGTGKTTVLTHHLSYLIQEKKVDPSHILAVTFTNKAAQEMEERVDNLLPFSCFDLRIGTFHSLGQEILMEHGLEIGLPISFKILDQKGVLLLMRQSWDRFRLPYFQPLGDPSQLISALIKHFSRCKDEGITVEKYQACLQKMKKKGVDKEEIQKTADIIRAYKTYQELLIENNAFDFGDLINYSFRLLEKKPKVLEYYRKRWPFIVIDEFQDTNSAQYRLMKLLSAPKNNLTVCASGDQAIYQWRGASFNNVLQFTKDFPKAKIIVLKKNYRSCQEILDLSYKFIQANNPHRLEYQARQYLKDLKIDNHLLATKKGKAVIKSLHFSNQSEEINEVIKKIQELLRTVSPNDIAILARTHQTLRPFEEALKNAGLDCQTSSSESLYHQALIVDLLAYFQLLNNFFDDSSFYRVINLPFWKIKTTTISQLMTYRQKGISFFQGLKKLLPKLEISEQKRVQFFLQKLESYAEMMREKKISEGLILILEETGWLKWLIKYRGEKELVSLNKFYQQIKEFETNSLHHHLYDFLQQMQILRQEGSTDQQVEMVEETESIKVMTVHAAKGLEFEYVFLVGLVNQRFPSQGRGEPLPLPPDLVQEPMEGNLHLEEERRLFYVALTRAKKGLFLTWADDYGGLRQKKPSRFLKELGLEASSSASIVSPTVFKKPVSSQSKRKISLPKHRSEERRVGKECRSRWSPYH